MQVALEIVPNMPKFRVIAAGLAVLTVSAAIADFDGPAPLSWRWIQPTKAGVRGVPLVDGDTIYIAVGQRVFALDRATGNQKWRYPLLDPIDGVVLGTPAFVDGTLVVTADNKHVYGVDAATGQEKWQYTATDNIIGPAVIAGKYAVIAQRDNSLMALDPATGTPEWKSPVKMLYGINGQIYGSGDNVLVMDTNNQMVSISAVTQKPAWTAKFATLDPASQPVILGDLIIVNSGQYLAAVRKSNGRAAWQIPLGVPVRVGPAASGDGILVVDENGMASYYSLNGKRINSKPFDLGGFPLATAAIAGKNFIVPTTNGAINLVDPIAGKVIWSYLIRPIGIQYNVAPQPNQQGFGRGGGQQQQNSDPDQMFTIQAAGTPVVAGDTLLVLAKDGSLLAFDKNTGIDLTPPAVRMSWPQAGDQVNGESLEVLFKIEDEASGINEKTIAVSVDGNPIDVKFGRDGIALMRFNSASKNPPLTNGRKVFEVMVSDWMGNAAKEHFVLTIDNSLRPVVRAPSKNQNNPGGKGGGGGVGPGG